MAKEFKHPREISMGLFPTHMSCVLLYTPRCPHFTIIVKISCCSLRLEKCTKGILELIHGFAGSVGIQLLIVNRAETSLQWLMPNTFGCGYGSWLPEHSLSLTHSADKTVCSFSVCHTLSLQKLKTVRLQ